MDSLNQEENKSMWANMTWYGYLCIIGAIICNILMLVAGLLRNMDLVLLMAGLTASCIALMSKKDFLIASSNESSLHSFD